MGRISDSVFKVLVTIFFQGVFLVAMCVCQTPLSVDQPLIANEYVLASRIVLSPGGKITLPENGHVHLLISDQGSTLSVNESDRSYAVEFRTGNLRMFEEGRRYQITNAGKDPFSGLWVELKLAPGRVICSETKSCPWSIRPRDPLPIFLSEHVTVFRIDVPWKPERHSLVVPDTEVEIEGKRQARGDPMWMTSPSEITSDAKPAVKENVLDLNNLSVKSSSFVEIAFYEKPFCFCKRVRSSGK